MATKHPITPTTPSQSATKPHNETKELQFERDLYKKKLERLQTRYDERDRKLDWINGRPYRFLIGRFYHLYIKRDQKL